MEKIDIEDFNEATRVIFEDSKLTMEEFAKVIGLPNKQCVYNRVRKSPKTGKYNAIVGIKMFKKILDAMGYEACMLIVKKN